MNNDLISREALKKNCAEVVKSSNNSDFIPCPTWNKAMELIDNAPTIDINTELSVAYLKGRRQGQSEERQKGEWKINLTTGDIFCSRCKEVRRDTRINHTNFCNSCGADMRGENKNVDG